MMATYEAGTVGTEDITLVASQVDTITFDSDLDTVEVVHLSGSDAVWYTLDPTVTPAVGSPDCYVLPSGAYDTRSPRTGSATTVKIISSGTPTIRVQRGD